MYFCASNRKLFLTHMKLYKTYSLLLAFLLVCSANAYSISMPASVNASESTTKNIAHVVEKGETLYGLSKKYNVSQDDLIALNPGIASGLKKGQVIVIPQPSVEENAEQEEVTIEKNEKKTADETTFDNLDVTEDTISCDTTERSINVAFMMPYMLNDTVPSKQALLYTEFYKGFLLAVKDVSEQCDNKINVFAYDTNNKESELTEILNKPEMKNMDLIFAADGVEQLNLISDFCKYNKVHLVNTFSLKSENYNTNPYFFQVNIPQAFMHAEVCNWFDTEFPDYEVVFIHKKGSTKKDMAVDLMAHLNEKGYKVHETEYAASFTYDMLTEKLEPAKKYVFIPTTGTKSAMSKLMAAVKRLRTDRIDLETAVFGFPEWVTYVDGWSEDFHATNTYFYSRFFENPKNEGVSDLDADFDAWYGGKMINAAPQFGLLGYDTGMYFLKTVCESENGLNNVEGKYEGLQSAFNFERVSETGGYINKSVFFIHFTTDNRIETVIK